MPERDGEPAPARPDYFADFPEEFEQRPDAPPRDQARRARRVAPRSEPEASEVHRDAPRPGSALARIEAMRKKVEALARGEDPDSDEGEA